MRESLESPKEGDGVIGYLRESAMGDEMGLSKTDRRPTA